MYYKKSDGNNCGSGMNVNRHPWGSTSENSNLRKIAFFPIAPQNIHTYTRKYIYRCISKKSYDSITKKVDRDGRTRISRIWNSLIPKCWHTI